MAGAFGFQFLFFSFIFYGFLAFMLSQPGAGQYLSVPVNTAAAPGILETFTFILFNPFSTIGFLSWLSFAIGMTDAYIIITSFIP
jgi:hypothetical protein